MNSELRFYLSVFTRRLPWFLAVVITVSALGIGIAKVLPPVYQAQGRLLVEAPQIPGELAASTVHTGVSEQLQIIEQRLRTRANLIDMAARLKVYENFSSLDPTDIANDMRARTTFEVFGGRDDATIVTIAFEARDAETAARVASEFVTFILAENVRLRTGAAGQTLEFFRSEVARLSKDMDDRSEAILAFQLENRDALPDNLETLQLRRDARAAFVAQLLQDERALNARRDRFVETFERTGRIEVIARDENSPFLQRLQALQRDLDTARLSSGADSPIVRELEGRVAALQRVIEARIDQRASGASAYQLQLDELDAQIAAIAQQRTQAEADIAELGRLIGDTLSNTLQLEALQRAYDAVRGEFERASGRLSAAQTGDVIEASARGERISVIEPVIVPRKPAKPKRSMIALGAILAGLGLGAGLVVLMERLNQAVRRPLDLTGKLGIAPLATLPYLPTRAEVLRRRFAFAGSIAAVVLGIPALFAIVHVYYMPLDLLVEQALNASGLARLFGPLG